MEGWAITSFEGDYRFLSNFYPSPIEIAGLKFPTVEHAYQASKSMLRGDWERLAALSTPGEAKRAGQELELRADWEDVKVKFMLAMVRRKFSNTNLRERLLLTEGSTLVEGNHWHDQFWGSCVCAKHQFAGKNYLGRVLMQVRREVKNARL